MNPIKPKIVLEALPDVFLESIDIGHLYLDNETKNSIAPNKAQELYDNYVAMNQLWEMDITHEVKIEGNQSTEFVIDQLNKKLKDPEIKRLVIKEKTLTVYLVSGEIISHTGEIQASPYPDPKPIFTAERHKSEPPDIKEKL